MHWHQNSDTMCTTKLEAHMSLLNMPLSPLPHQSRSGNLRTENGLLLGAIFLALPSGLNSGRIPRENQQGSCPQGDSYVRLKLSK